MNNFSKHDSSIGTAPKINSPSKIVSASPTVAPIVVNDKKDEKSEIEEDVIEEDENYSEEFD